MLSVLTKIQDTWGQMERKLQEVGEKGISSKGLGKRRLNQSLEKRKE